MKEGRKQWINREEVHAWAIRYLAQRKLRHPDQEPPEALYGRLASRDKRFITEADKTLLKQMRGAWSQKKSRTPTSEKKPASFVLSLKAAKALGRLAGDWGLTKTMALERIIADALKEENASKLAKKDDGVYQQRAELLKQHLEETLRDLCLYQLSQSEMSIAPAQQIQNMKVATQQAQQKLAQIELALPELPSRIPKKGRSRSTKIVEQSKLGAASRQ